MMEINSIDTQNVINNYKAGQAKATGDFADKLAKAVADQSGQASRDDAKLREACKGMEAVFLNMMLSEMRKTVPKTGLLGDQSNADEIMKSMLDSEMTKNIAQAGGIGLGDMLYRQLRLTTTANGNSKSQAPK